MTPEALAALCGVALPEEQLTPGDVATCCNGPDTEIFGDDAAAGALTIRRFGDIAVGWILLVAVVPERRREGRARALVDAMIERGRAEGVVELHTGNAAPRYVWAGVDVTNTAATAFFESLGFEPYDHALNMSLPTGFRAPAPPGTVIRRETGDGAAALARREWAHWEDEVARGVERGTCFVAVDDEGTTLGFACHSVNRHGWIGPMATDPARQRGGVGHALLGALAEDIHHLYRLGTAEISWVTPVGFYAKAGAHVSRAFRISRLKL